MCGGEQQVTKQWLVEERHSSEDEQRVEVRCESSTRLVIVVHRADG